MTLAQVVRHLDTIDLAVEDPAGPPPGSIGRLWLDGEAPGRREARPAAAPSSGR